MKSDTTQVGDRIKIIRQSRGLTAKEVARRAEIPYSTYSNYENNNRVPKLSAIRKIATVLDVSIAAIADYSKVPLEDFQDDFATAELSSLYFRLNEHGKNEAIKRLRELTQLPQYSN